MALPPINTTDDWTSIIGAAAETIMKANISIYDPTNIVTVPYDPATDEGGYDAPALIPGTTAYDPVTKLGGIKARIMPIRFPRSIDSTIDWSIQRPIRFQIPLSAVPGLITKGLLIRVNDGGDDPALKEVTFSVEVAVNGSEAAVRTIECLSNLVSAPTVS